ncbi:unnamed protein product [Rhodiola kirilowii]
MAPAKKRTLKEINGILTNRMKLRSPSVRRPPPKLQSPKKAAPPAKPKPAQQTAPVKMPPVLPTNGAVFRPSKPKPTQPKTHVPPPPPPAQQQIPVAPPLLPPVPPSVASQVSSPCFTRKSPRPMKSVATQEMRSAFKLSHTTQTVKPLFSAPTPPPIRPLNSKSTSTGLSASIFHNSSDVAEQNEQPMNVVDAEMSQEVPQEESQEVPHEESQEVPHEESQEVPQEESQEESQDNIRILSIREQSANCEGDEEKRGKRGVVNGTKLANIANSLNGAKIKLTFNQFNVPDNRDHKSLIVHEIGSVVREEVPMVAATYGELPQEAYDKVITRLDVHFEIDLEDEKLWDYMTLKATERFKDWKYQCKQHYLKHGAKPAPKEFQDRKDQWKWLCAHFETSKYKNKCAQMKDTRKNKINHHSGKMMFIDRAQDYEAIGERAPFLSTYAKVYGVEPAGAALVEKMNDKLLDVIGDQEGNGVEDILPVDVQVGIIEDAVGKKRGRHISGVGNCMKKPPRPKGGYRLSAQIQAELQAKADDRAMVKELQERVKMLEEMMRGSNAVVGSNASDGATSLMA